MLSSLFKKPKKTQENSDVANLFSRNLILQPRDEQEDQLQIEQEEQQQEQQQEEQKQIEEESRLGKVVFVGNIKLDCTSKEIIKLFKPYGQIEKVWFRSVPVDRKQKKIPIKAAVIIKQFQDGAQSKNCYILFKDQESAENSLQLNGQEFKGLHIRVDIADRKKKDLTNTVFVGNLPFKAEEEDIRMTFEQQFGLVDYCRLIRDRISRIGKGFGYIKFKTFASYKKAITQKTLLYNERQIRIQRAVPVKQNDDDDIQTNAKNANKRIQQKVKSLEKEEQKKLINQKIKKTIKKVKNNPNVNKKEIKKKVQKIKGKLSQQRDSNIFNRQPVQNNNKKK